MFDFAPYFGKAHGYDDFLDTHGPSDRPRWQQVYDRLRLTDDQIGYIKSWTREMHVLCVAGAWCGDCVRQCPHMQVIAEANPLIKLRYFDRDEDPALRDAVKLCAGNRVPVVIFLAEDDAFCSLYGDRTLSTYREMAATQTGAACPVPTAGQDKDATVISEWLAEFERVQLMLRTSSRLRQKHGD